MCSSETPPGIKSKKMTKGYESAGRMERGRKFTFREKKEKDPAPIPEANNQEALAEKFAVFGKLEQKAQVPLEKREGGSPKKPHSGF